MNNSFIANLSLEIDKPVDTVPLYREKESKLRAIINAIYAVSETPEWKLLQREVFDGVLTSLENRLQQEIKKKPLNGPMIHSLNGQIEWAEKYTNLTSLADIYKQEVVGIRNILKDAENKSG